MRVYQQKQRTQGKLPLAMNIFILGIVSINLAAIPVASIVMYFIIKNKIKHDMPIFLKSPSSYRKSYRFLKIGELLATIALWLSIGVGLIWLTYIAVILVYAMMHTGGAY